MINKESIAVRRDGLLGLGNAGWEDSPSFEDINYLIAEAESTLGVDVESFDIIDDGYYDVNDLPFDTSWCKSEYGSIELPQDIKTESWRKVKNELFKQANKDCGEEISDLLTGSLSPILVYEDHELIAGKERIILAKALAIPVKMFILKNKEEK